MAAAQHNGAHSRNDALSVHCTLRVPINSRRSAPHAGKQRAAQTTNAIDASNSDALCLLVCSSSLQSRCVSTSSSPSSAAQAPARISGTDNPLVGTGLGLSALARPGGRQSVSGIVATVFGGSGMLGRFVVNHLGRIGSQVITPYRSADGMNVRHLKLAGDLGQIVPIPFDMADMDSIRRCVAKSNVVINCIGLRHETVHYSFDDVHAKIAYRLAQVSKAVGVERFIQISAVGADPKSGSKYFQSKAMGEQNVRQSTRIAHKRAPLSGPRMLLFEHA